MKNTDVLVIGGSAAGIVAAVTAKSHNPEVSVTVIRKEEQVVVPCGIPYIYGSLENSNQNVIPDATLEKAGVDLLIDEVVSVDLNAKNCSTKSGETLSFDKIIFATGSMPKVPKWLKGSDLEGVYTIPKNKVSLDQLASQVPGAKKIVVIGGGFIGVEVSDELNKVGKDVTLVEVLEHVLGAVFDNDIAEKAENVLKARGVNVKSGSGIKEITGQGKVTGVTLENGEKLEADIVILAMGYIPNTDLAKSAGLELNSYGQIKVDEYMRTECTNVFAVGDCAQKHDFITRRDTPSMLASTACAEARIAGINLYNISVTKNFKGTVSIFSTAIGNDAFGVAGLNRSQAEKQNIPAVCTKFEGVDKHPGKLPGTHSQMVELVVAKDSGLVLGGTVTGGLSAGELVNIIGFAIQNNMTVYDILTAQIGTHPLLTAPPTAYPLIKAAEIAVKKLKN
ncbi:MAG TPA: FAD-dependent oxidoreductase [Thermotogota bacterium]|nr:FAD-dependent oxidoreductase [Thermotogota bacterium]